MAHCFNRPAATRPAIAALVAPMTFQETPLKREHVVGQDISDGVLQAINAKADVSLTIDVAKVSPGVAWPDTVFNNRLRELSQVSAQARRSGGGVA